MGLGFNAQGMVMHRYGQERNGAKLPHLPGPRVHVRMVNRHHIVTFFTSPDGKAWGRPVGVAVDKAGAILLADDVGNIIWRVTPAAK